MSVASVSVAAALEAGRRLDWLLERPRVVLGSLIGAQIVATAALAFFVTHNGWVYFQGGDQVWLTSEAWLLGQLELPPTETGYLWSYLLAPIMWVTGPTYVQALPPLVVLQVLVLGPIALLCTYGIAARIGGRLLGYWAAFLWVIAPFAAIPLFVDRYQERFGEHFLPQALGLTAMADFPSMVLVLASAFFLVRSLDCLSGARAESASADSLPCARPESAPADSGRAKAWRAKIPEGARFASAVARIPVARQRLTDAAMAGLLLGAAGGMKPPNLLMGFGAALAYLVARRWRGGLVFGAAVVPTLLVILLWKERGLGSSPLFSLEEARLAAGAGVVALDIDRYIELDVDHWRQQMNYLREFFWSARLAQWAPFAGLLALLRVRRGAAAALLTGWLGAFILVKGFSTRADIQANTFWRLLMPAWPAYLLLLASIPLLVPTLARRLGDRLRPPRFSPVAPPWLVLVAVLTLAVPAVAIAVSSPLEGPTKAVVRDDAGNFVLTSVDVGVKVRTERTDAGQRLTWTSGGPWRATVFYHVYRTDGPGPDVECEHTDGAIAVYCFVRSAPITTTRELEYVDPSPPEDATYRVGVATNWADDPEQGDVFAFSPPVSAAR